MAQNTSQHILGTASNLLGICLFIITSMHVTDKTQNTLIDEFTSIVALGLLVSSILSFISMRTLNIKRGILCENIAEYFFMISLVMIFAVISFIIINYWGK